MATAKQGDTVKIHYTGKLNDGTVFDSSEGRDPLEFKLGEGKVIPGFEEVVIGMEEGEAKTETIPADKAYGPHRPEMVMEIERSQVPPEIDPEVGQQLQVSTKDGQRVPVHVIEVTDESVKLDANHQLAGKDLTFELKLVAVG